jgi:high-affinity nickel-transport protein
VDAVAIAVDALALALWGGGIVGSALVHSLATTLLLGVLLGLKHATEADHVLAVTTLLTRQHSPKAWAAARIGAMWGVGHSIALLLLGSVVILLGVHMPPALAFACDTAVAVMLVLLGASALWSLVRRLGAARAHTGAHAAAHAHGHEHDHAPVNPARNGGGIRWRSVLVGFVHGASGTAALTLWVLTTIPSRALAIEYLVVFGLGSIGGMAALSLLLSLPLTLPGLRQRRRLARLAPLLEGTAGAASIVLGVLLAFGVIRI